MMHYLFGFVILLMCLYSAKAVTWLLDIAFPAPLLGMVLLFLLLLSKKIPTQWIEQSTRPILTYLALFFIPAGVGLINHLSLFKAYWEVVILALLLVPIVTLSVVGLYIQRNMK